MSLMAMFNRGRRSSSEDYLQTVIDTQLRGMRLEAFLFERYGDIRCLSDSASASVWRVAALPVVMCGDKAAQTYQVLKIFPPNQQSAFRREAAVALGAKYPHVVECLETFVLPDGHACLAYEYAADGSLASFLANARFHASLVRQAVTDSLRGLASLHAQGYVHCDIKPANVLVARSGQADGITFKLADLGSAATLKEAQSGRYGVGSPAYCAPERLYNQFGFSSDIYSIGVMAFELLTGHLPFIGEVDEVYRAHLTRPMPLGEIKDPAWREWLEQAVHKLPRSRFQNPLAALAALEAAFAPQQSPRSSLSPASVGVMKQTAVPHEKHGDWVTLGDAVTVPEHSQLLAGEGGDTVFLATDKGLQSLRFSTAELLTLTSAKPPYSLWLNRLIYSSGSRVLELTPATGVKTVLHEQADSPSALAINTNFLAFVEQRRLVLQRRADDSICLALRHRHYAMDPLLALGQATFAMTAGLANNELWIRSTDGDLVSKLKVDGPWLGLSACAGGFLAVSSSLMNPEALRCHFFSEDGIERHVNVACDSLEVAVSPAGFAYVSDERTVTFLSPHFESRRIDGPSGEMNAIALSPSGVGGISCYASFRLNGVLKISRWTTRRVTSDLPVILPTTPATTLPANLPAHSLPNPQEVSL